jgi:undecaprenyl phosphate-alpha-L-ara4FN deformylase
MEKTFTLRVDMESGEGIKEGIPKLLDILKKHNIKASFYIVMGGESNLLEILKYPGKKIYSDSRKIKIWSLADKLRMAFLPRDFAGENIMILKRILDEGHELGIHGWKHREWTRGLDKINIQKAIGKAISKYAGMFGKKPVSFAAPGFNTNSRVLEMLEKNGIRFISDFEGDAPQKYGKMTNVPITICGEGRTPIIEYLASNGKNDAEIFDIMKKEIQKKKLASFYIHDLFEARFKIGLLDKIMDFLENSKIKNKRIIDY